MAFISEIHCHGHSLASAKEQCAHAPVSTGYIEVSLSPDLIATADRHVIGFYDDSGIIRGEYALSSVPPEYDPNSGLQVYRFNMLKPGPDQPGEKAVALCRAGEVLQFFGIDSKAVQIRARSGMAAGAVSTPVEGFAPGMTIRFNAQGQQLNSAPVTGMAAGLSSGTLIATSRGEVPVERLQIGDAVLTADHGPRKLRWIGGRRYSPAALAAAPDLVPVRIRANALAPGLPSHDLVLSPQYRILIRSKIAQRMFGQDEVLVAARHLLTLPGCSPEPAGAGIACYHIATNCHEIITANGAEIETLYPGSETLQSIFAEARDDLVRIFPLNAGIEAMPARPFASGRPADKLVLRHRQNAKPLVARPAQPADAPLAAI
ncbi:MAG: Hint domain-containing protein [Paracoccus sp. (in: a-proteobacteria)]